MKSWRTWGLLDVVRVGREPEDFEASLSASQSQSATEEVGVLDEDLKPSGTCCRTLSQPTLLSSGTA
ncbi:unnamed protein product [Boreogadus saida]